MKPYCSNYQRVTDSNSLRPAEILGEYKIKKVETIVTATDKDFQAMAKEREKIKRRGKVQREFHSTVTGA